MKVTLESITRTTTAGVPQADTSALDLLELFVGSMIRQGYSEADVRKAIQKIHLKHEKGLNSHG
jgi:hypothetical protein